MAIEYNVATNLDTGAHAYATQVLAGGVAPGKGGPGKPLQTRYVSAGCTSPSGASVPCDPLSGRPMSTGAAYAALSGSASGASSLLGIDLSMLPSWAPYAAAGAAAGWLLLGRR